MNHPLIREAVKWKIQKYILFTKLGGEGGNPTKLLNDFRFFQTKWLFDQTSLRKGGYPNYFRFFHLTAYLRYASDLFILSVLINGFTWQIVPFKERFTMLSEHHFCDQHFKASSTFKVSSETIMKKFLNPFDDQNLN